MSSIRQVLACLCLALTATASLPSWAESGKVSPVTEGSGAAKAPGVFGAFTVGASRPVNVDLPLKAEMQQTAGTTSSGKMSGKKKAWIIVASVLGAVAIGAAVSHHGGGGSGGGGGY